MARTQYSLNLCNVSLEKFDKLCLRFFGYNYTDIKELLEQIEQGDDEDDE